ncbi:hypothetical protein [Stappia sp. 28M-7]|uniref:hypothetical protein n=1 Tax=Stappia sp. 28M-7 TaxID=2762596 RepID=UPI00163C28FC|nr:hypothetical protein [Stappia sp. 28M-7]MBC2858597.1 hypothetical protein [Stappia sp. 28M-7]
MIPMLLKTKKPSVACAILWLLASITPTSAAADIPKFRDFTVDIYKGPVAAPNLSSNSQAKTYRTRLRDAAKGGVNFAGHYILASWGCGTSCATGAVIDARNGDVFFFPFFVCCWGNVDDGFHPIEFRKNSTLVVFAGLRNEQGPMGAHFYDFRSGNFAHLKTIETNADFGNDSQEQYEYPSNKNQNTSATLQPSRNCMLAAVRELDDGLSPASDIATAAVTTCSDYLKKFAKISASQQKLTVLRATEIIKKTAYEAAIVMVLRNRGKRNK